MRRDIFLYFLNRDTREVFGLYDCLTVPAHTQLLRQALNVCAILCENQCIAPPGFIVEDEIAFLLAENQQAYLQEGLIQLPMREDNLADFAEKKRTGYEPMRDRYSGLFSDTRIGFLGRHATGIIKRKTHITEGILLGWENGPDQNSKVWQPVKKILTAKTISDIGRIPRILDDRGVAVTWAAIVEELPTAANNAGSALRNVLQHVYFGQYCREFKLIGLNSIPHVRQHFDIPFAIGYDYRALSSFLDIFFLRDILFEAPAQLILELRKQPGFIAFIDGYGELAKRYKSLTDLQYMAGLARAAVKYPGETIAKKRFSLYELSYIEIRELGTILEEVAAHLSIRHDLPTRLDAKQPLPNLNEKKIALTHEPQLVLYVALEEELKVLAKALGLTKNAQTPEATGKLGDIDIAVICPRYMGRVPAAVSMAHYLAKRQTKPKLILIVGLAGGFSENDTREGHIIVATKVVDLALRKVIDEEKGASPNFRREDYKLDDALMNQILSDDLDIGAWAAKACDVLDWPPDRRPSIHTGMMASADEVVASDKWRQNILSGKGGETKLLGVEMEAGGICEAARRAGVPVSMMRVISDQADPSKADNSWRTLGMRTLADLLSNLPMAKLIEAVG